MGWLRRGRSPKAKRPAVSLDHTSCWAVVGVPSDLPAFLRAIPKLLPDGGVLYLEGGTPPKDIKSFLQSHRAAGTREVKAGTLWPRPQVYQIPIQREVTEQLAELMERHVTPEACMHLHALEAGEVLLEGYDAFFLPFYVSKKVPEDKVRDFCIALGCFYEDPAVTYERVEHKRCYCDIWEKDPELLEKRGIPRGHCGICEICGKPGHVRPHPAVLYDGPWGAWCDRHYPRLSFMSPGTRVGCLLWLVLLAGLGVALWLLVFGD